MDLETRSMILGNICEGCLSVGRKLSPIYGDESNEFRFILEAVDNVSHTIRLCWECTAILQRTLRFREQVKQARDCLVGYMLHQSSLTPLSRLSVTLNDVSTHIIYSYKTEVVENPTKSTEDVESNNDNAEDPETNPVAFIKIEMREVYDDDDVYADVNVKEDTTDDKDLKAELKSDAYEPPVRLKQKQKVKKDHFDDSDDEPLKKKADEKSKKKNEKTPKGSQAKREKPEAETEAGVVNNARVAKMLQQLNVKSGQIEMVVLSWEEVEEERAKALVSETFTRHKYRCYDCVLGFNHRMKLDDHMKKHDPAAGSARCAVCGVRCKDARALQAHRRRHRLRWRCGSCGESFSSARLAADHLARVHRAPIAQHACALCGHVAQTLGKLRYHRRKNHAERQKCELCGKSFKDRTALRLHLLIHRGEKEYACSHCDKKFVFKRALEVHLVTHDSSQQLYCHQCDKYFKNQMSFYQHTRYNLKHVDPANLNHVCPECDKRFAKSSQLREHHVAVHLKHTAVRCAQPDCTFACSSRSVLRTHVRVAHRNAGGTQPRPPHLREDLHHYLQKTQHENRPSDVEQALKNTLFGKGQKIKFLFHHDQNSKEKKGLSKKTLEGHPRSHSGERPRPAALGYDAALYNHNKLVHKGQSSRRRTTQTRPRETFLA